MNLICNKHSIPYENGRCKLCNKEYQRNYYINNNAKLKKTYLNRMKDPATRYNKSRSVAKRRGIEFSITLEQYLEITSQPCYYCNHKLCKPIIYYGGLDRLDNNLGYQIGNVVSCGKICNVIKNEFLSSEETLAAVEAILKVRNMK